MKRTIRFTYAVALFAAPPVLLLLPPDFFDHGPPMCISVLLFNRNCYGCGMTRAVQHFLHLDFSGAMAFNKLSLIVFPLLVYLWATELRKTVSELRAEK